MWIMLLAATVCAATSTSNHHGLLTNSSWKKTLRQEFSGGAGVREGVLKFYKILHANGPVRREQRDFAGEPETPQGCIHPCAMCLTQGVRQGVHETTDSLFRKDLI